MMLAALDVAETTAVVLIVLGGALQLGGGTALLLTLLGTRKRARALVEKVTGGGTKSIAVSGPGVARHRPEPTTEERIDQLADEVAALAVKHKQLAAEVEVKVRQARAETDREAVRLERLVKGADRSARLGDPLGRRDCPWSGAGDGRRSDGAVRR
jgi:outer membrane murein-binding lipoprotein Lpp